MSAISLPVLAGMLSTTIFAWSALPMLVKAGRSKDLTSYSPGNLVLSNVGNLIHSVYVFSMPPGPIWVLHSFYTVTSVLMLGWYVRYAGPSDRRHAVGTDGAPQDVGSDVGRTRPDS